MTGKCLDCKQPSSLGYPNKWREPENAYICSRCYGIRIKGAK